MMNKLLIKNGLLISQADGYHGDKKDILIENGLITAIEDSIEHEDIESIDAQGCIISPGLIDIHTHCFTDIAVNGIDADIIGVSRGTTTILDAGSAGPENFEIFNEEIIKKHKTKVYSLLNISKKGLVELRELDDLEKIDEDMVREMVRKYPTEIVGLKARASSSVCGSLEIIPIKIATDLAHELDKPIMIHTGNFPPYLQDVLNLMKKKDVLTHAFHGKKGGILNESKEIIEEAVKARQRGVLFDVGHGSASFSFKTFKRAKSLGFYPDFVSTDLHCENYEGPVYSQHAVITKLINIGETLEDCLENATSKPADHFGLDRLGHLKVGYFGDLSISKLEEVDEAVVDSMGDTLDLTQNFVSVKTVISRVEGSEIIDNEKL